MLIVNLTTTSSRVFLCKVTIYSLLNQKKRPDIIRLWISHDAYLSDEGFNDIPDFVHELNNLINIIEVIFVPNTGPYRKILPALRRSTPDDVLVYADDDVIYGEYWLSELYEKFMFYDAEYIVASRVRIKKKNILGRYKSYISYKIELSDRLITHDYIITGMGGAILMKKHVGEDLLQLDSFSSVAPRTDDLWLSYIFQLSGATVATSVNAFKQVSEISHDINSLTSVNNPRINYGVGGVFLKRCCRKVKSYLGLIDSNNDKSMMSIVDYFIGFKK